MLTPTFLLLEIFLVLSHLLIFISMSPFLLKTMATLLILSSLVLPLLLSNICLTMMHISLTTKPSLSNFLPKLDLQLNALLYTFDAIKTLIFLPSKVTFYLLCSILIQLPLPLTLPISSLPHCPTFLTNTLP